MTQFRVFTGFMGDVNRDADKLKEKLKKYFDFKDYYQLAYNVPLSQKNLVKCVVFDVIGEAKPPAIIYRGRGKPEIILHHDDIIVPLKNGIRCVIPLKTTSLEKVKSAVTYDVDKIPENMYKGYKGEILKATFPIILPKLETTRNKADGQMIIFEGEIGAEAYLTEVLKHVCKGDKFSFSKEDPKYSFDFYFPDI